MDEESPPLVTLKEAARLLGRDPRTVTRWANAGDVDSIRLGGRRYISQAEVERILRAREETS
jgi:excisionase family DNA binding protein